MFHLSSSLTHACANNNKVAFIYRHLLTPVHTFPSSYYWLALVRFSPEHPPLSPSSSSSRSYMHFMMWLLLANTLYNNCNTILSKALAGSKIHLPVHLYDYRYTALYPTVIAFRPTILFSPLCISLLTCLYVPKLRWRKKILQTVVPGFSVPDELITCFTTQLQKLNEIRTRRDMDAKAIPDGGCRAEKLLHFSSSYVCQEIVMGISLQ